MLLWTIQAQAAYKRMLDTGVLRADENHLLFEGNYGFKKSYLWMSEQMRKRIGNPLEEVRFPVWAWYQWEGKRKRIDMRSHGFSDTPGEPIVLLTVDVPEDRVLLSDFDNWHFVLNNSEVPYIEDHDWDKEYSQQEKEDSWELIFNYDKAYDDCPLSTQATMWEIRREWVKKAEFFKTRLPAGLRKREQPNQ
ncbi:MAG: DUF3841 domain-containing protein [Eubacteriales bacterium]|nr:DUF3841 domain-containing protein [Eubacteriales bacterium]